MRKVVLGAEGAPVELPGPCWMGPGTRAYGVQGLGPLGLMVKVEPLGFQVKVEPLGLKVKVEPLGFKVKVEG